jgi:hypothetical protein
MTLNTHLSSVSQEFFEIDRAAMKIHFSRSASGESSLCAFLWLTIYSRSESRRALIVSSPLRARSALIAVKLDARHGHDVGHLNLLILSEAITIQLQNALRVVRHNRS